jgi:hypothetical protein
MLMKPMGSLGRVRRGGMELLIRLKVGLGVVINGGIGGVMGRSLSRRMGQSRYPGPFTVYSK